MTGICFSKKTMGIASLNPSYEICVRGSGHEPQRGQLHVPMPASGDELGPPEGVLEHALRGCQKLESRWIAAFSGMTTFLNPRKSVKTSGSSTPCASHTRAGLHWVCLAHHVLPDERHDTHVTQSRPVRMTLSPERDSQDVTRSSRLPTQYLNGTVSALLPG